MRSDGHSRNLRLHRLSDTPATFFVTKSLHPKKPILEDMLQGVGPAAALGQDIAMLKGILDKTAERVGKDMATQPAVEAELRSLIGTLYLRCVGHGHCRNSCMR